MLCLGIDSGTKSTKTLVLDIETGEVVALAQCAYGTIEGLPPGHVEQDPATWIDAAETTVTECLEKIGARRGEIKASGSAVSNMGWWRWTRRTNRCARPNFGATSRRRSNARNLTRNSAAPKD